jgi:repressor LexA
LGDLWAFIHGGNDIVGKTGRGSAKKRRRGRRPAEDITEPQRRTLSTIQALINRKGYPPTVKELAAELDIASGSAYGQINQLVRKGYLRREPRKARSLEVVASPKANPAKLVSIPVVGEVAAGSPLLAEENIIGEVLVDPQLVGHGRCFALRAKGDSMTGAGIHDGDYCIVRQQPVAENGEIVVALLGDKGVVKRLHVSEDGVELRSENPAFEPIRVDPDAQLLIQGKLLGVCRGP